MTSAGRDRFTGEGDLETRSVNSECCRIEGRHNAFTHFTVRSTASASELLKAAVYSVEQQHQRWTTSNGVSISSAAVCARHVTCRARFVGGPCAVATAGGCNGSVSGAVPGTCAVPERPIVPSAFCLCCCELAGSSQHFYPSIQPWAPRRLPLSLLALLYLAHLRAYLSRECSIALRA